MVDPNRIPQHIAIIMDGNGRWAKQRGLPRTAGHRQGVKRVKEIMKAADELGVKVITFFAFSSENWQRPKSEIKVLMRYLDNFLDNEIDELHRNSVRFLKIGRDVPLPEYLQKKIAQAEEKTRGNTGLTVVLALNYGSQQEIVDAVKKISADIADGKVGAADIDTTVFSRYLYTAGIPDPDLLIRTSGEMRISNFLLWQLSYAELYFPQKNWPDFGRKDLEEAIEIYQNRERRFGNIHVDKKNS